MTTTMAQPGLAPDINLLEAMDIFKNFPDEELPKYRNDPKLALVAAAEMDRRLRIRKDFEAKQQKPSGPIIDQLQQQLMAPPMQQPMGQPMQPMGQPMQQPMEQTMAQPEMQQQGLGSLVPGMAQGGPVAFQYGGGVGAEFGAYFPQEEEKELKVPAYINGKRVMATPAELRAAGYPESTIQQRVQETSPKPAPVAGAKPAEQKPADQTQGQNAQLNNLIASILANRQPTAPAAPAAPSLGGLAAMAKDYTPEINPPMSPEERRKIEDEYEERRRQKFPDTVSPIMAEIAQAAGQQVDPEEARRRAFMKAGIAGLGYQGRDFGGGLAGMLEGYQGTKESIEAANKEAKMNQLKARLAGEQYKDALKRKDYESAQQYAQEMALYKRQEVEARNQFKVDVLGIMSAVKGLTTPNKVAGTAESKGALTAAKYADIREKAIERAQPDLKALDSEFQKRADMWFSSESLPKAWRTGKDEKSKKAQEEYETRRKQIINKHANDVFDALRAANPLTITKEQVKEMLKGNE